MSERSTDPMRRVLRALTHGVYVLSVTHEEMDHHVVISLLVQCSVQPPRVAFAVAVEARILPALRGAHGGVLTVLGTSDTAAVRRYGTPGGIKHAPAVLLRSAEGHPVPPEAAYWLTFRIVHETAAGDHVLFVADAMSAVAPAVSSVDPGDDFHPLSLAATGFPYAG